MTIHDKIRDEKLEYDINREAAKILALSSGKIDKYEYLAGEETLLFSHKRLIEQVKLAYSPLTKVFEKQIRTIEDQREKQIKALKEHGEEIVKSSYEKKSLKQKEILEELPNKRIDEIQNLSKQIDFDN